MAKITELAARKIKEMQKVQAKENTFLRICVLGDDSGAPNFGLTLEESKTEDDTLDVDYGISIIADIELATTLEGTVLDYIESNNGGSFQIRKVKVDHAEGCGGDCGEDCGEGCGSKW